MEILELFPHEYVDPEKLDTIDKSDNKKIYITVLTQKDLVELKEDKGGDFDKQHYYANPSLYKSKFKNYYDKISFLINCMNWDAKFPRAIIEDELCEAEGTKFLGFCDISADYEGSIEVTRDFSHIEEPFRLYSRKNRAIKREISSYEEGDVFYHCVDHLPAEIPVETSQDYGKVLLKYLPDMLKLNAETKFEDIKDVPEVIMNAIMIYNGALTKRFAYIADLRKLNEAQKKEIEEKKEAPVTSLSLSGHIFDTKFLNTTLDILESAKICFRINQIVCAKKEDEDSSITLKVSSDDASKLSTAVGKLLEVAEEFKVKATKNYD